MRQKAKKNFFLVLGAISFGIALIYDAFFSVSGVWQDLDSIIGSKLNYAPELVLMLSAGVVLTFLGGIVGGLLNWRGYRKLLISCIAINLVLLPAQSIYLMSQVSAIAGFLWAVLLGWAIAPAPEVLEDEST